MRLTESGEWPDEITIKASWGKAHGRPWNADLPYGYVRLIRGSSAFLRGAAEQVLGHGVELVASPPLAPNGSDATWLKAGFEPFLHLHLYRRSLVGQQPDNEPLIEEAKADFDVLAPLDRLAFDPLWRMDLVGLRESYRSADRSTVLTAQSQNDIVGYAIVGVAGITGYLQRIAVHPSHGRQGHGRRLVRTAIRWAANHGAATMVLNTQPENSGSAALYRSEGFARIPGDLRVLKYAT